MCNPRADLAFSSPLVWGLLVTIASPVPALILGGGRKVKENDRFVCVFSKVNGSTLSEKIHVEWYV